ncbi:YjfI family protein [Aliikangiella sp. IMCC44359]|uniref:YjfI family protein n=1 Tax=Aliikangiella sp. IMCC44359 TaxID=3459125 RepID=UPI00403AB733
MSLKELAIQLNGFVQDGFTLDVLPIQKNDKGDLGVLQVTVEGFDELPIFVTATDEQILCVTNLFTNQEVSPELVNELNAMLLKLTVNVPLSSFGMIDDQYVLFGAMSVNTLVDNIAHELVTQAENSLEALEALEEFLK